MDVKRFTENKVIKNLKRSIIQILDFLFLALWPMLPDPQDRGTVLVENHLAIMCKQKIKVLSLG